MIEGLQTPQLIAPLIFVVATIYILYPALPLDRSWARILVGTTVAVMAARYIGWRYSVTLWPTDAGWAQCAWIWLCFAIEAFGLFDSALLFLLLMRSVDRTSEADRHEARLRAMSAETFPSVDVFIATYNEPLEVLEKSITGALCLDYPSLKIWVLDDGRRAWLKQYCQDKGVGYITRPDNAHAKAGNINHALSQTNAEFFAIFDADFVPQRNFLMRTMGFFVDPRIGIVQVPHTFYNHDPMQSNLALRKSLPDDQRFFFEAIMPARDAWNAAFCCGSNSVTRRSALKAAGDRLPTESITEDMLLTLKLLRKGYITRYLNERLAIGLAPESVEAFFIQRKRWARGAIQILYLRLGPLGPGLALLHRLFFLPTHWLSQSLLMIFGVLTPVVFLWTGMMPLVNVTPQAIVYMLLPSVLAITGGIWVLASKQYFPFAVQVIGLFQSIKLLPTILMTVIKPRGHIFKVTPKGAHAHGIRLDREVFWFAAVMIVLTLGGVLINASHDLRIIAQAGLLPVVAAWSLINVTILILVCMMAVQSAARRGEERFHIRETVQFLKPNGFLCSADVIDISLSGLAARVNADAMGGFTVSDHVCVAVSEVGIVRAHVVRLDDGKVHVKFDLPPSPERDLLVRKIFTSGFLSTPVEGNAWTVMFALLASILKAPSTTAEVVPKEPATPALLPSLPAATFVIHPPKDRLQWNTVSEDRRFVA